MSWHGAADLRLCLRTQYTAPLCKDGETSRKKFSLMYIIFKNKLYFCAFSNLILMYSMFKSEDDFLEFVDDLLSCFNFSEDVRHFICCQSALETGFGTSRICLENCNLFGMKKPSIRPSTCSGSCYGHAIYNMYRDSVVDYMLWLSWTKPKCMCLYSIDAFVEHLVQCHYAEDKNYIFKIKNLYSQYYG